MELDWRPQASCQGALSCESESTDPSGQRAPPRTEASKRRRPRILLAAGLLASLLAGLLAGLLAALLATRRTVGMVLDGNEMLVCGWLCRRRR